MKTKNETETGDADGRHFARAGKKPHLTRNSGNVEWYTPPHIVEAARAAMGSVPPRPFLKWAGGKTWELPILRNVRPRDFGDYHEPFLGGGAHLFDLLSSGFAGRCHLGDLNAELIRTYAAVRQSPGLVLDGVSRHIACHCERYYCGLRDLGIAGMSDPEVASRMIYLNRAGYNGLYRVNRQGKFNVSWGKRDRVAVDAGNLFRVSSALRNAIISQGDFGNILDRAKPGDFAFIDPPYCGDGFAQYTAVGFDDSDHRRLHSVCVELDRRNVLFVQTNADCGYVRELYGDFHVVPVRARRNINCDGGGRGTVGEVVIMNY